MRLIAKVKAPAEGVERQRCTACRKRLPLTEFGKFTSRGATYHRKICKACRRGIEAERQREKRG